MPIPMYNPRLETYYDLLHKNNRVTTAIPLWPRRCAITGKWLWIKPAIRTRRLLTGPGDPIDVICWAEPKSYTMLVLANS